VPAWGMILAAVVPALLVIAVRDMAGLADLYAVGVVGAIATNLGATSTDRGLAIKARERALMFGTFLVMAAIEVSLLFDKPSARYFTVTILAVGLILRGLVQEQRSKKSASPGFATDARVPAPGAPGRNGEVMLCAVRGPGRTLDFAMREARETGRRLYLLFVREQRFLSEQDAARKWEDDPEAREIFENARSRAPDQPPLFCYAVSESASQTIVDIAATLGASRLILGAPRRHAMTHLLRGNLVREVSGTLPEEIDLLRVQEVRFVPRQRVCHRAPHHERSARRPLNGVGVGVAFRVEVTCGQPRRPVARAPPQERITDGARNARFAAQGRAERPTGIPQPGHHSTGP